MRKFLRKKCIHVSSSEKKVLNIKFLQLVHEINIFAIFKFRSITQSTRNNPNQPSIDFILLYDYIVLEVAFLFDN